MVRWALVQSMADTTGSLKSHDLVVPSCMSLHCLDAAMR